MINLWAAPPAWGYMYMYISYGSPMIIITNYLGLLTMVNILPSTLYFQILLQESLWFSCFIYKYQVIYIYIHTNIYINIYIHICLFIYNILVRFLSTQLLSLTSFEPRFRSSSYVVARCTGVREQKK